MESILVVIFGYLLGSVPFAYLAGRLVRGIDIREYGTRSVGGSNVYEQVARWPAVVVGLDSQRKVAWPAVGEPHRSGYSASLRLGAGRTWVNLIGLATLPLFAWALGEPPAVIAAGGAMFFIVSLKRLEANREPLPPGEERWQVLKRR